MMWHTLHRGQERFSALPARQARQAEDVHARDDDRLVAQVKDLAQACACHAGARISHLVHGILSDVGFQRLAVHAYYLLLTRQVR